MGTRIPGAELLVEDFTHIIRYDSRRSAKLDEFRFLEFGKIVSRGYLRDPPWRIFRQRHIEIGKFVNEYVIEHVIHY